MLTGPAATIGSARRLRTAMSLPETILWTALRTRPGGHKFRRQHPAGPFILDFACLAAKLAIEIDGEAHRMGSNPHRDDNRDEWLAGQGFTTLRIAPRDVLDNLAAVVTLIATRCGPAQPLRRRSAPPPPRTGEELQVPPRHGEVAVRRTDGGAAAPAVKS
ncbi:DUF559 domain-containing protein [Sphingomonas sp.]|uniref:endonuclease domain-containing protein n=1 Tax=Sphingomonas sp. TaxID=28214 RepID=UPI00286E8A00|nr:DUF559 domain-containing protein [Sphingomonas sp.]